MMIDSLKSMVELNCNIAMPGFGLGVYKADDSQAASAVRCALEYGYRMIDTAWMYENESGVGEGVRSSGVPREDVFLVTKIWPTQFGDPRTAIENSLRALGTDYIDMYMMHWPGTDANLRLKVWETMLLMQEQGKIRSCGVSNFLEHHLKELQQHTGTLPACDEIEFHPWHQQKTLRSWCSTMGIAVMAWGPMMHGHLSEEPLLAEIGEQYGKTAAQIVLRWDIQSNVIPIPKSVNPNRIHSNADVFSFSLSESDMARINGLDGTHSAFGANPDTFNG